MVSGLFLTWNGDPFPSPFSRTLPVALPREWIAMWKSRRRRASAVTLNARNGARQRSLLPLHLGAQGGRPRLQEGRVRVRRAARARRRRSVRGLRGGGEAEQKGSHDSGASSLLPTSPPTRASRALEPNEPAAGAGPRRAREAIATPRPHPTRSRPPPRARRRRACGRGNRQNPERWGFFPRASASRFRFRPSPRSRDPSLERSRGRALTARPSPFTHLPLSTEPQGASA